MLIASTPFSFKGQGYLGKIYRPYISVLITSERIDEWIPTEMIVDSGADYTLLPRKYAQILSVNLLKDAYIQETSGVGGKERVYLCKNIMRLKIGSWEKVIPVGFLSRDDIPGLLGRLACLEALKLTMVDLKTILEK